MGSVSQIKAGVLAGATLLAGLAVVGVVLLVQRGDEPAAEAPPPATAVAPPIVAAPAAPPSAAPSAAAPAPQAQDVPPPAFDVVRVAEDGGALVAGSAAAGAAVILSVDDAAVAETAADNAGQFVALFTLPPSDAVQILSLEMVLADGRRLRSADRVVLAPRPEAVAALLEDAPGSVALALLQPEGDAPPQETAAPPAIAAPETGQAGHSAAADALAPVALPADEAAQLPAAGQDLPPAAPAPAAAASDAPAPAAPAPDVPSGIAAPSAPPADDTAPPARAAGPAEGAPGHEEAVAALANGEGTPVTGATDAPVDATPPPAALAGAAASDAAGTEPATTDAAPPTQTAEAAATPDAGPIVPRAFVLRGSGTVELLDSAPTVMENVVIDTISYSDAGEVRISGRASSAADGVRVQVYLDNAPIALALAENGDWSSDLPAIDPGVYVLRVDQIDEGGQVVSRFETPFQREDPDLVRAARAQGVMTGEDREAPAEATASTDAPATPDASEAGRENTPEPPAVAETALDGQSPPADTGPVAITANAEAAASAATGGEPAVALITVQPGHSLWRISEGHYGEGLRYLVIYNANRSQIRNPDLIYPGQIFVLPD